MVHFGVCLLMLKYWDFRITMMYQLPMTFYLKIEIIAFLSSTFSFLAFGFYHFQKAIGLVLTKAEWNERIFPEQFYIALHAHRLVATVERRKSRRHCAVRKKNVRIFLFFLFIFSSFLLSRRRKVTAWPTSDSIWTNADLILPKNACHCHYELCQTIFPQHAHTQTQRIWNAVFFLL